MDFSYDELAKLNRMICAALLSGRIKFDDVSESVHKKVAEELSRRAKDADEIENK